MQWFKKHTSLLSNIRYKGLSLAARGVYDGVQLLAGRDDMKDGVLLHTLGPFTTAEIANELCAPVKVVSAALNDLLQVGLLSKNAAGAFVINRWEEMTAPETPRDKSAARTQRWRDRQREKAKRDVTSPHGDASRDVTVTSPVTRHGDVEYRDSFAIDTSLRSVGGDVTKPSHDDTLDDDELDLPTPVEQPTDAVAFIGWFWTEGVAAGAIPSHEKFDKFKSKQRDPDEVFAARTLLDAYGEDVVRPQARRMFARAADKAHAAGPLRMRVNVAALKRNWGMFDGDPTTIDDGAPSPYAKLVRQAPTE